MSSEDREARKARLEAESAAAVARAHEHVAAVSNEAYLRHLQEQEAAKARAAARARGEDS